MAYYRDAIFAIGEAFNQIENNCTGVSEATGIEFCGRQNITSGELAEVVQGIVWYGSTGLVDFDGSNRQGSDTRDVHLFIFRVDL